jgi:hypothetical protein
MAQAVSRRLLTGEHNINPNPGHARFMDGKVAFDLTRQAEKFRGK